MTKRKFILIKFIPSKISENALLAIQKDQKSDSKMFDYSTENFLLFQKKQKEEENPKSHRECRVIKIAAKSNQFKF